MNRAYFDPRKPPPPGEVGVAARNPKAPDLRVYVASGWGNREGARALMEKCQAAGFAVTYDWTDALNVSAFTSGARSWCAEQDIAATLAADVLVVVEPDGPTCGMWIELGVALGQRRPGRILFVPSPTGARARTAHEDGKALAGGAGEPFISHQLVTLVDTVDQVVPVLRGIALGFRARREG